MGTIFIDAGRSAVKALRLTYDNNRNERWQELTEPTLLAEVSRDELAQRAKHGSGWPDGWYIVNGKAYAFGQAAMRQTPIQPQSADRYVRGYAGVIGAIVAYRMTEAQSDERLTIGTMFPPADYVHAEKLLSAVKGKFRVEGKEGKAEYTVDKSLAVDEPLGGLMSAVLNAEGRVLKQHLFNQDNIEAVLVADFGGYTIDFIPTDVAGGIPRPDSSASNSHRGQSAIHYITQFERAIRLHLADELRGVGEFKRTTLESALRTGYLRFGNQTLDVTSIRDEILNEFAMHVENLINQYGGIAQYQMIALTGGGAGLLYSTLKKRPALSRIEIRLLWNDIETIAMANVYGLSRLYMSRRSS